MRMARLLPLLFALTVNAQSTPAADPFQALAFLRGTWEAKATRPDGVAVVGAYSFGPELRNNIWARHSTNDPSCKGPASFDCAHSDLLYVYPDGLQPHLRAIYFDNEGHVIHYDVSTPSPERAIFLSDAAVPGPQFRLVYELKGQVMSGKFQMRMPGQSECKSYLEWTGGRR